MDGRIAALNADGSRRGGGGSQSSNDLFEKRQLASWARASTSAVVICTRPRPHSPGLPRLIGASFGGALAAVLAVARVGPLVAGLTVLPMAGAAACAASDGEGPEYIVVGSGAGGGPLAARLARAGHRVLLLEAGSDVGGKLSVQVPAFHALSTEDEDAAWWYFVQHHADPALDAEDTKHTAAGILYPRGSAVGGSTAVNAMVTVLPSRSDWDHLAAQLDDGAYRASAMAAAYERVRAWLPTAQADPALASRDRAVSDILLAAARTISGNDPLTGGETDGALEGAGALARLLGGDLNAELAAGEATGLFRLPLASANGARRGPREHILETIAQGYPLTLQTEAFVTRVLFDEDGEGEPAAIGVEYVRGGHVYEASLAAREEPSAPLRAFASREVILAAGTFNSPQLLMLSGIGDSDALQALGIEPRVHLPGVGHNLQDRYEAAVVTELERPLALLEDCHLGVIDPGDPCLVRWRDDRAGLYTTSGFLASALVRSAPDTPLADLQLFASPSDVRGYYPGYSRDAVRTKNRISWVILKAHTHNDDGFVALASDDPFARPHIQFNSYDERDPLADPDLLAMVAGVKKVRAFAEEARARSDDETFREIWPGPDVASDDDIARFVRRESWGHHACCTNPMGRDGDERAVLDARFRVRGARNLRVVDASVFPKIPGTFVALPIFMMSERAAELILEDVP